MSPKTNTDFSLRILQRAAKRQINRRAHALALRHEVELRNRMEREFRSGQLVAGGIALWQPGRTLRLVVNNNENRVQHDTRPAIARVTTGGLSNG